MRYIFVKNKMCLVLNDSERYVKNLHFPGVRTRKNNLFNCNCCVPCQSLYGSAENGNPETLQENARCL